MEGPAAPSGAAPKRAECGGSGRSAFRGLSLGLTARCNLSCAYCYQRRASRDMDPRTASLALGMLEERGTPPFRLELTGGEPLLSRELALACAERFRTFAGSESECVLATNGLFLDGTLLDRLVEFEVTLALSFDGVSGAQDLRAPGSGELLVSILGSIRKNHPAYFRRRVRISAVLVPETVPHLAESCRRLMDTGVSEIRFQTAAGADRRWSPGDEPLLFRQVEEAAWDAARRYEEAGSIPLEFLRPQGDGAGLRERVEPSCNTLSGESLFVDPWGVAWTCPLFATSLVRDPAMFQRFEPAVRLGPADSPAVWDRLVDARSAALTSSVLAPRTWDGASAGSCGSCPATPHCRSCPATRFLYANGREGSGPPPFHCAFERAAAEGQRRFEALAGPIPPRRFAVAVAVGRRWFDGSSGGTREGD
ncbi:MAG: radical SAM protein [Acidobacteriota bacterium]